MSVKGFLESRESLQICGWAYDSARPQEHLEIEVLCGDQLIGRVHACMYRRDLEVGEIGQGDHAFILNCAKPLEDNELDRIMARVILSGGEAVELMQLPFVTQSTITAVPEKTVTFTSSCFDETHRPVFILGSARSGTSAVAHGLLKATRYEGQEEGHFLEVLAPLLVHLHSFYDGKLDEYSQGRNTMIARIPERFVQDGLQHIAITAAAQLFPSGYWIEKTPNSNMIHLAPRLREIWPNARFIFMKRRAIDNLVSRMNKFSYDFAHNCREWANAMAAWLAVRDQMKGAALELDQQFVAGFPQEAAAEIGQLLQLDDIEQTRLAQILHHARPQRTTNSLIPSYCLERLDWPQSYQRTFLEICGPMMAAYNYTMSQSYYEKGFDGTGCLHV